MANVMGKIMAEVLCMLAIATKEIKQRRTSEFMSGAKHPLTHIRTETFFKKLIGKSDIEDALQRLDKLEQGELRTVAAQVLKTTSDLRDVASDIKDATSGLKDAASEIKDGAWLARFFAFPY